VGGGYQVVSKKKKDWLKKSLAAERRQKRTDPEGFKKTLSKRREQVEDTKSKIKKKEEITKTKKPTTPTKEAAPVTPVTPKVDEPVRLGEPPEEEKEQGFFSKLWKPDIFKQLESEGRLHAGSLPIGLSGLGGTLPNQIKVSGEAITKIKSSLQNKAIVGKLVEAGKGARGVTGARFATNAKSIGLTKSWFSKLGGVPALIAVIGSYPFAGFIKEESLQTLSFGVKSARYAGNLEGEQVAIDAINEILDPSVWQQIFNKVPFANVLSQLKSFYESAITKNELDQQSLDKRKAIQEGEIESDFAQERRVTDEAARERELAQREEDTAFFAEQEATRMEEEKRIAILDQQIWRLRREGKFDEADELELTKFK